MAKDAAQNLQQPAQDAVDSVKATAQEAAETVKSEGQTAGQDVKSSVQDSKETVQQHQQRPDTRSDHTRRPHVRTAAEVRPPGDFAVRRPRACMGRLRAAPDLRKRLTGLGTGVTGGTMVEDTYPTDTSRLGEHWRWRPDWRRDRACLWWYLFEDAPAVRGLGSTGPGPDRPGAAARPHPLPLGST